MSSANTPQNEKVSPEKMPEIEYLFAQDFKMIYVNHIQASFSPFDITFNMGEALGASPNGKFTIQHKTRVTIAPLEAKIFLKILTDTIANFEKSIGPITVPPNVMPDDLKVIDEG